MSVMQIAGKSPENTAKGIAVTTDGKVKTEGTRKISGNSEVVINANPTTADAIYTERLDFSQYGVVSLRIYNLTGVGLTLKVVQDFAVSTGLTAQMRDASGAAITMSVANSQYVIITPDDLPCLAYLHKPIFAIIPDSAPTQGNITMRVVHRE